MDRRPRRGLHRPVQKLVDTLICAVSRKAQMQPNLSISAMKNTLPPSGGGVFFIKPGEIRTGRGVRAGRISPSPPNRDSILYSSSFFDIIPCIRKSPIGSRARKPRRQAARSLRRGQSHGQPGNAAELPHGRTDRRLRDRGGDRLFILHIFQQRHAPADPAAAAARSDRGAAPAAGGGPARRRQRRADRGAADAGRVHPRGVHPDLQRAELSDLGVRAAVRPGRLPGRERHFPARAPLRADQHRF